MTHLYKIKDKSGNLVTFRPNTTQLQLIADTAGHRYNYYLKYRQGGITTYYAIDELDEAAWIPGMTCAIIAHERDAVTKIFQIVKRAFENIPEAIRPKVKYDNKNELYFVERYDGVPLDSHIYVAMKVRSGTVQKLHITESAFIKDRQELKAGSKQAVPLTGRITEETTGNGFNEFYDDYQLALNNPSPAPQDYKAHFFPWVMANEYTLEGSIDEYTPLEKEIKTISKNLYDINVRDGQLLWRRWKSKELSRNIQGEGLTGEQLFKQEYPLTISEAFQSGAGNVFNTEKVESISPKPELKIFTQDSIQQLHQRGFKIYYEVEPNALYFVGVDPTDGDGADFSCIDIWKYEKDTGQRVQVAQYYGKLRPDELAQLAVDACNVYNKAFLGVENNMLTTILWVVDVCKYDNYYFATRIDEKTKKKTKKLGWNTNSATRDVMIDEFNILFDEDNMEINSPITLGEMKTFVKKDNGKREHADGKHDDSLFAAFIVQQIIKLKPGPSARILSHNPLSA